MTELRECPRCGLMHLRAIVEGEACTLRDARPLADRAATAAALAVTETERVIAELRGEVARLKAVEVELNEAKAEFSLLWESLAIRKTDNGLDGWAAFTRGYVVEADAQLKQMRADLQQSQSRLYAASAERDRLKAQLESVCRYEAYEYAGGWGIKGICRVTPHPTREAAVANFLEYVARHYPDPAIKAAGLDA